MEDDEEARCPYVGRISLLLTTFTLPHGQDTSKRSITASLSWKRKVLKRTLKCVVPSHWGSDFSSLTIISVFKVRIFKSFLCLPRK